jgi:hypothetical protein
MESQLCVDAAKRPDLRAICKTQSQIYPAGNSLDHVLRQASKEAPVFPKHREFGQRDRKEPLTSGLVGEHFADTLEDVALLGVEREELESVAQALTEADDGADFKRVRTERKRDFEGNDFTAFQFAGEGCADAILTEFSGASPAIAKFSALKHAHLHPDIDSEAWEAAASFGSRLRSRLFESAFLAGGRHTSFVRDQRFCDHDFVISNL